MIEESDKNMNEQKRKSSRGTSWLRNLLTINSGTGYDRVFVALSIVVT